MWGFTGILGKIIKIDALYIVWHRVIIATIALFIGLYVLKMPMRIANRKTRLAVLGVGIIVSLHWLTFYASIQLSTASLGILCLSTTTLHVTWLEPLLLKKKFSWIEFLFGLLVVFGIYIVADSFDTTQYLALIIGLCSALFAALFSVLNARLAENAAPSAMTLHEIAVGCVFMTIVLGTNGMLNASLFDMTYQDFLWLLFLGILCTSVAFLINILLLKRLGAFTVTLSINLEPVYTILLAIPILHENQVLNGNFYQGAIMIIVVVIANAIYKSKFKDNKSSIS
jgi:drug/metabolite transporter (DMT)-like permease